MALVNLGSIYFWRFATEYTFLFLKHLGLTCTNLPDLYTSGRFGFGVVLWLIALHSSFYLRLRLLLYVTLTYRLVPFDVPTFGAL